MRLRISRPRLRRQAVLWAAAGAAPLMWCQDPVRADSNWNVGTGVWSLDTNWSPTGVPASGADIVSIISNDTLARTVTFDYSYASPFAEFVLDNVGGGTNILALSNAAGQFQTSGDQIIARSGVGTVYHSAGTNAAWGSLYIGSGLGVTSNTAVGLYAMSNGASLTVGGSEYIGSTREEGTGTPYGLSGAFNQTGGAHDITGNLNIGYNYLSNGSFSISGGTLDIGGEINLGWSGTGSFVHSGGTVTAGSVILFADNAASYSISAGSLNTGSITVRSAGGTSTFTMTGGAVSTLGGLLEVGPGAVFTMSGSSNLAAGPETISGSFTQSSGTHTASSLGGDGSVQLSGGTYNVGAAGASIGTFTLSGSGVFGTTGSVQLTGAASKFTQSGGAHNVTGSLLINATIDTSRTDPHYALSGGTVTIGVKLALGDLASTTGRLSQTGGTLSTPILDIGRAGQAVVTLSGGTLTATVTNIYAGGALELGGGNFLGTSIGTLAGRLSISAPTTLNLSGAIALAPTSALQVNADLNLVSPAIQSVGGLVSGTGRVTFGASSGFSGSGVILPAVITSAPITAKSGNLTLAGPSLVSNSGATLSNNVGSNLFITATSVTNSGNIAVNAAGSVVFENAAVAIASGKSATLAGGALAAPTLINNGSITGSGQFTGNLTNAATVTLNGPSQFFGPVLNQATGNITVRNSQLLITGLATNNGTMRAQSGGSIVFDGGLTGNPVGGPAAGAAVLDASSSLTANYIRQESLALSGVAGSPGTYSTASVRPSTKGGDTSVLASLAIQTDGTGAPLGTLDLADNALIVNYSTASPVEIIRAHIINAYGPAAPTHWSGTGITSSAAAADASLAIGYGEASTLLNISGTQTALFRGQTADATSVLLRCTIRGDANLDGAVGFADLVAVAQNYNTVGTGRWHTGDFTYDGDVNFADLVAVAQNYNQSLAGPTPGASAAFQTDLAAVFSTVPEPGGLGLAVTAGLGLLTRRRTRVK